MSYIECSSCGEEIDKPVREVKENEDGDPICEECLRTTFDDLDFPHWIGYEFYQDNWELYDHFVYDTGVDEDTIPDKVSSNMKYATLSVWYKVTEEGVEGPYDSKYGEKIR